MNEIPIVTVISIKNEKTDTLQLDKHKKSIDSQDYPNKIVLFDQTDRNKAVQLQSESHLYLLIGTEQILLPGAISKLVKVILSSPNIGIVYCDSMFVKNGAATYVPRLSYSRETLAYHPTDFEGSFLFASAVYKNLKGFKKSPNEVYDFLLRAGELCVFEHLPETLIVNASSSTNPADLIATRDNYEKCRQR